MRRRSLRCASCGAPLPREAATGVATCSYCGSTSEAIPGRAGRELNERPIVTQAAVVPAGPVARPDLCSCNAFLSPHVRYAGFCTGRSRSPNGICLGAIVFFVTFVVMGWVCWDLLAWLPWALTVLVAAIGARAATIWAADHLDVTPQ